MAGLSNEPMQDGQPLTVGGTGWISRYDVMGILNFLAKDSVDLPEHLSSANY